MNPGVRRYIACITSNQAALRYSWTEATESISALHAAGVSEDNRIWRGTGRPLPEALGTEPADRRCRPSVERGCRRLEHERIIEVTARVYGTPVRCPAACDGQPTSTGQRTGSLRQVTFPLDNSERR